MIAKTVGRMAAILSLQTWSGEGDGSAIVTRCFRPCHRVAALEMVPFAVEDSPYFSTRAAEQLRKFLATQRSRNLGTAIAQSDETETG